MTIELWFRRLVERARLLGGPSRERCVRLFRSTKPQPECLEPRTLLAGTLDPYFGQRGLVTTLIGDQDAAAVAALQSDGKIVIAGGIVVLNGLTDVDELALARYLPNGQPDDNFGPNHDGEVILNPSTEMYSASAITVINDPGQPDDGEILVAGAWANVSTSKNGLALARFNSDGNPDSHFGNGGVVLDTRTSPGVYGLVVEPGGGILVGAVPNTSVSSQPDYHPGILRFNADGSVDSTFADPGFGGSLFPGTQNSLSGLVLENNGDIIAAGSTVTAGGDSVIAVARFTPSGELDPTFGSSGIRTTEVESPDSLGNVTGVALGPNGIVVVGYAVMPSGTQEFLVTRDDLLGNVDPSFNGGALDLLDFSSVGAVAGSQQPAAVTVQPDGKVLVAGTVPISGSPGNTQAGQQVAVALARLNSNGSLDTDFGNGGEVLQQFDSPGSTSGSPSSAASSLLLQQDGNIVVSGVAYGLNQDSFALARFLGGSSAVGPAPTSTPPLVGPITAPASPVGTGATVAVSASFTYDSTQGPCTAIWNWGDGTTSSGSVTESNGSGSVTGTHAYQASGVYSVTLTVTDNSGASGRSTTAFPGIAVWQPVPESLTGNIRLLSPRDAIAGDSSLTGSATLVLDARFNASGTPKGKVALTFKPAHLSFKSTALSAVAVNGTSVWLEGTGTVNGALPVDFLLTVAGAGARSAKIRLQVWAAATGAVVYDSQPGAAVDAAPTLPIRGGTLALHVNHRQKATTRRSKSELPQIG